MHTQASALRHWITTHRRELLAGSALAVTLAAVVFAGPWLLLLAAVEWKQSRRDRLLALVLLGLLARAVVWLWRDIQGVPHGRWHPCARCGAPIEAPSRAWYCSPGCRRYARFERHAAGGDERAQIKLERLGHADAYDPELAEVPF
jgi:hypothetical protein